MFRLMFSFILLIAGTPALATVKLSSSGICHSADSPWYERTKKFTAHSTMQSCLDAGGRHPKGASQAAPTERKEKQQEASRIGKVYSRAQFGKGWSDTDGDCQDSRAEALIAASTIKTRVSGCKVISGRWISPFTGQVIMDPHVIDIDHLVPLHFAWYSGAQQWTRDQREKFANDPINLLPVEASLNRQKGSKGPDKWLPPSGQCQYVARFKRVILIYKLELQPSEAKWINQFLSRC